MCRLATFVLSLDAHCGADGCWRGTCGVLDVSRFALIMRCRSSRITCGTCQAKDQPENVVVNPLPSKRKKTMLLLFSPVLASALYIGGGSVGLILLIVVVGLLLRG